MLEDDEPIEDRVALFDLDDTLANYTKSIREQMSRLRSPLEEEYIDRHEKGEEPPYQEARRKLIQGQPGFWRNLDPLLVGFEIVEEARLLKFEMHVLTKGPTKNSNAWSEKLEWSQKHFEDAIVTVTGKKSLVYGRVLVDDFPTYFRSWIRVRKNGLVICVAQPWNADYAVGGKKEHPNVLRYDGTNREELRKRLRQAYERESRPSV